MRALNTFVDDCLGFKATRSGEIYNCFKGSDDVI
jgi:hypothetical protein